MPGGGLGKWESLCGVRGDLDQEGVIEGKGFPRILSAPGRNPEQGSLLESQTEKLTCVALCMMCMGDEYLYKPVCVCS